jgi:20S proteasome alpha/beta subunit
MNEPKTIEMEIVSQTDDKLVKFATKTGLEKGNNILDSHAAKGLIFPKPKRKKKPVTVIIGIICEFGIVLASDSQTTFGDNSKRCDAEKIRVVKFKESDDKVLVAQSGSVETSSRAIDVMEQLAADRKLENEETVISTVQKAMHKVRTEIRHQNFDCSAEEFDKIITNHGLDCSLMTANFFDKKPFIHTFNFQRGTTENCKTFYESTGCGSALSNYILSELCSPKMDSRLGQAIAVYVVDKAIKHVAYCDRPIRLATIYPWESSFFPSPSNLLGSLLDESKSTAPRIFSSAPPLFMDNVKIEDAEEVEKIINKVTKIDEETKPQRIKKLREALISYADTMNDYSQAALTKKQAPNE